jgi:esterase/lipase superfamily enzyme
MSAFGLACKGAIGDPTTARRPRPAAIVMIGLAALVTGCSSRPYGDLVVGTSAPGASTVDLLVATTRAPVVDPPGVMFGGERGKGFDFADIVVSIPPDHARKPGEVQWPSQPPGDPAHDFVTLRADRMDLAQAKAEFNARVKRTPGRKVLIFVHGYNTRFEEAVSRFAQIVHDAHVEVAPVLFTWPSGGRVIDYVYDRDSAIYSRDALETLLQKLSDNPNVGSISILAHSMGNYLTVEALRQMAIRDRGLPTKIRDVMLASPDIDVDVFRRQIAEIDAVPRGTQFTLFVSRDDKALGLSSFLARDTTRLGALDPTKEPYFSMLEKARVNVVDLTSLASNDVANHSKFATGEVVAAIGERLSEGQALTDAKQGLVQSLGTFTRGAVDVAAGVAVGTVTAPTQIMDPTRREESVDTAAGSLTLQ